jgi:glycosyltransferase involved in cell wall biosynthesis
MDRLRILFLIDNAVSTGGAERFAIGLATNLAPSRFEVWLCSTRLTEPRALETLARANVRHVHLGRRSKLDVHRFAGLVGLLRRGHFDILHTHKFGSNVWGSLIGAACGVPAIVAHEHSWSYEGEPLRRWLDGRVVGRIASAFVAVSSLDAERMARVERVPAEKIVQIPTAYLPSEHHRRCDLRAELGLAAGTPLVGTVAVLRPEKALEVLLDAHRRLLDHVADAHLVIAGDGGCRQALEAHAQRLGIESSVHFLGMRADVDSVLACLDVAALSSDREGMPLMAFECFANGTPLVATAVGGLLDLIEDGVSGVLVARRDPDALAEAIAQLLGDPQRRARLATAAAQRLGRYRIEAIADRFASLYEQLASRGGAPAQRAPEVLRA